MKHDRMILRKENQAAALWAEHLVSVKSCFQSQLYAHRCYKAPLLHTAQKKSGELELENSRRDDNADEQQTICLR